MRLELRNLFVSGLIFAFCISGHVLFAQDDLLSMLEAETKGAEKDVINYTSATFKTTRLMNGHSVEHVAGGVMDFRIAHRFGAFNTGLYNLFGLDQATMRMGLEYGLTDWLMIGGGRSTFEKTYDGFVKVKMLRQSSGARNMPITMNYVGGMAVKTVKFSDPNRTNFFTSNFFYLHQLLIGRKFNEYLSIQLMPTVVHRNLVEKTSDPNDIFAMGIGGRMKLTRRVSINVEYYYQLEKYKLPGTVNSLAIGFDIETGGHVFQLSFTNSPGMHERQFITETTGQWSKGDILGGFSISRVFTIKDPRKRKVRTK